MQGRWTTATRLPGGRDGNLDFHELAHTVYLLFAMSGRVTIAEAERPAKKPVRRGHR